MTDENDRTEKLTVELTKEEQKFLEWVAGLEGVTPQEYLVRAAKGKLLKTAGHAQPEE